LSEDVELLHSLLRHTPLGKNCPSQSLEDIFLAEICVFHLVFPGKINRFGLRCRRRCAWHKIHRLTGLCHYGKKLLKRKKPNAEVDGVGRSQKKELINLLG